MAKAIYFDMDGTIADLYGVEGWLDMLRASDPTPYRIAKPLLNMRSLARRLNTLQRKGYTLGIISWLSKDCSPAYAEEITQAKREWLAKHLGSVKWDELHFVAYGTRKSEVARIGQGILFDDDEGNREEWGIAYSQVSACSEKVITETLVELYLCEVGG